MQEVEFLEFKERLMKQVDDSLKVEKYTLPEDELMSLTNEQAEEIAIYFGNQLLIRLPKKERDFFDWLKVNDNAIWQDLWGEDENPYLVGISYLPDLLPKGRGFPICDLMEHQNFYFTRQNITPENGEPYCDGALAAIKREDKIRIDQAFIVEIWRAPIDQWRFAYMYNVPLNSAKEMVLWLLKEGILEFFVEAEEEQTNTDGLVGLDEIDQAVIDDMADEMDNYEDGLDDELNQKD